MAKVYLFDWGDTLMIDFPNSSGKMCDWPTVEAVEGAQQTLAYLSKYAEIYIVTGANDSSENEIKAAFQRVELSHYISGYFCKSNLGLDKGTTDFMRAVLVAVNKPLNNIVMVGDNYTKDIEPALCAGVEAIWFTDQRNKPIAENVRVINKLTELCC